jgi:acetolactate synthase-1/2/3 large subunit
MWAAQYYRAMEPRRFLTSGGLGTMGYGFPASLGAQVGRPGETVVLLTGDGSFQMCIQELATMRMFNLPVKVFIFNNGYLGMVRQWQEFFQAKRYSQTRLAFNPDFVKVAAGYDIPGFHVSDPRRVKAAIDKALAADGPIVVDFKVAPEENVFPMIPSGGGQTDFMGEGDE